MSAVAETVRSLGSVALAARALNVNAAILRSALRYHGVPASSILKDLAAREAGEFVRKVQQASDRSGHVSDSPDAALKKWIPQPSMWVGDFAPPDPVATAPAPRFPAGIAPNYERKAVRAGAGYGTTIVIGDLHFPWHHRPTLNGILEAIDELQPQNVVQIGDLYDHFSTSRFPRSRNLATPKQEMDDARQCAEWMWGEVRRLSPRSSCYQILGNHDNRPLKRVLEVCPEVYGMTLGAWQELYRFDGVTSILDVRADLEIDGVVYEHGRYGGQGRHMRYNMRSTVYGHTHRAHVVYETIRDQMLWELNVGYVADPRNEALSYPEKKYTQWVHGYGLIRSGQPSFIALLDE